MTPRLPLLLLGFSALGGCATFAADAPPEGPPLATAADRHVISVEQTAARLEIQVAAADSALSPKSREDLSAFASGYLRYGHGALIMSSPEGSANASAAARIAHEAQAALSSAGVSYSAMAASTYAAAGEAEAPIVVTFARYEARAPECAPLWEQDLAHQSDNQPWESFGCATQVNLAALVEDPRDLTQAREEDPRDSGRRDTTMTAYRQGDQTHATRSADERITISNAVQ